MKPEPINKHVVCSCCAMPWEAHGPNPSLENCVKLLCAENDRLADELKKRTTAFQVSGTTRVPTTIRRAS